ncbi:autotransporter outer membrane beta-barrel domain-containing protein [Polaribacter butkevichii]|uniref:tRNA modification GTPase n=1 Tax=Polaribacter butkevichii TaxID=218490 RepID=A0A2P6C8J2_9FLAO|nr:autotransporter outer membrane beta-barrel domain-containing protein [Polaribacter butkevichii]PQJ69244.1 hypothetical protein BTO14_14575 [Polaribacter butkevichii]
MKKNLITLYILILTFNCYSQIKFEKGFYVNNDGQKTECLIKNIDWMNNPTEFQIKLSKNNNVKTITIDNIKEVTIYNVSKHIRENVKLDKSSENLQHLSHDRNPIFSDELLFLKVLVEGKACLYYFENENSKRFFYKKNNSKIEPLVFKSYLLADNSAKKNNNKFRQQLWINLQSENISKNDIEKINYNKRDLVNLFVKYNNLEIVNFYKKKQKDLFNLNIRPSINNSSLTLEHSNSIYGDTNFNNKLNFGLGIEAEFILPFNKNKWAIIVEPTYQYFISKKIIETNNVSGGKLIINSDYKSIDIPIGLRHYFYVNENSKIFINFSFIVDLNLNSSIELSRLDGSNLNTFNIQTARNTAIGLGYKFNEKYSIELRYHTNRKLLNKYNFWSSDYKNLSIIFGYSIF